MTATGCITTLPSSFSLVISDLLTLKEARQTTEEAGLKMRNHYSFRFTYQKVGYKGRDLGSYNFRGVVQALVSLSLGPNAVLWKNDKGLSSAKIIFLSQHPHLDISYIFSTDVFKDEDSIDCIQRLKESVLQVIQQSTLIPVGIRRTTDGNSAILVRRARLV